MHAFVFPLMGDFFYTLDTLYQVLTLMQTGKKPIRPIVLLGSEADAAAGDLIEQITSLATVHHTMSAEDQSFVFRARSAREAAEHIEQFYRNVSGYTDHGNDLAFWLNGRPTDEQITRIDRDPWARALMRDDHTHATLRVESSSRDGPSDSKCQLVLPGFNQRGYGKLRQLLDAINDLDLQPYP